MGKRIQPEYITDYSLSYVRSFPEGIRNCYIFNLTKGDQYLIRPWFLYGNYDALEKGPHFELHIGPNLWREINITRWDTEEVQEIIHVLTSNVLEICLVKIDDTVPFISGLELRRFRNRPYGTSNGSLDTIYRMDIGQDVNSDLYRYDKDFYDRLWGSLDSTAWTHIQNSWYPEYRDCDYKPPQLVMDTASIPKKADEDMVVPLFFFPIIAPNPTTVLCVMYIIEIQNLQSDDIREFNIIYSGKHFLGPINPSHSPSVYNFTMLDQNFDIKLVKTKRSTLPPLLNAIELFSFVILPLSDTGDTEAEAMVSIKSKYRLSKISWQGDPCAPQNYSWEGLNCTYNHNDPPKIMSLNLSSSGLTGEISPYISNLTNLKILNLSNNNLTGKIPDFLSQMNSLTVLNLSGNNLTGPVPGDLLEKQKKGSLLLSIDGNPGLDGKHGRSPGLCESCKKKKSLVPYVVAALGASIFIAAAVFGTILFFKIRKPKNLEGRGYLYARSRRPEKPSTNLLFSYADVLKMTNNLERVLGSGGFGIVYHGNLDNTEVAVKVLSHTSKQGYKEFQTEVDILVKVHHRNLTSLVGYCEEDNKLALIYEFMSNGDLNEHLSGKRGTHALSWLSRLRIATESAQGLEYLHSGCKQSIVHRDVKPTNILLNEDFQAKLADFGISKSFPSGGRTHVTTVVVGTPGYLDPQYYRTNMLTEKSDVYSFGIVLLELITNQPVIDLTREKPHISEWVSFMLGGGDIRNIIDPNLLEYVDANSVWKVAELSIACSDLHPVRRPTMTQVVAQLNECLVEEISRTQETNSSEDSAVVAMTFATELNPMNKLHPIEDPQSHIVNKDHKRVYISVSPPQLVRVLLEVHPKANPCALTHQF